MATVSPSAIQQKELHAVASARALRYNLAAARLSLKMDPPMTRMFSRTTILALALAGAVTLPAVAQDAANFPNQSIRILITNPAGGLPDVVARIYGRHLESRVGQSVVVENRPGANGTIAVAAMLGSPANGYTYIVTDGSIYASNPALYSNLSYSEKDLQPVATLASAPLFLAVHPKVEAKTLAEFVEYVRARPGKLNYGSSGVGSTHHLAMVAFAKALKLEMVHVPFKGTGESVPALLGGHIEILYSAFPSLSGAAGTNQVRFLAANSLKRSSLAPDLPAVSEIIPDYDFAPLIGMYAKAGTPEAAYRKIAAQILEISRDPDVRQRLAAVGVEATGGGPEQHEAALKAESARVRALVEAAGLKK